MTSPSETARGNFAVYDLDRKLITLVGDVRLARQGSTINGSRLLIDLNTGRAVMDGGAPGRRPVGRTRHRPLHRAPEIARMNECARHRATRRA